MEYTDRILWATTGSVSASDLELRPGQAPKVLVVDGASFELRRHFTDADGDVTHWEYREVGVVSPRTINLWND